MNPSKLSIVICGTDTDIGKTIVSSLFVQGLVANYWKPIQSGNADGGDSKKVKELLRLPQKRICKEAYNFTNPVSPHWASELEDIVINPINLKPPLIENPLVIETAGGLMVPLNRSWLQIDQLREWDLPIVLVASSKLGTLNHTLLSLEALKKRKLKTIGIILNGPPHEDNPKTIEQFGNIPIIAHLPIMSPLTARSLEYQWQKQKIFTKLKKQLYKND